MKINFQETTTDLLTRISIHDKYGSKNIDKWMLQVLKLKPGLKILDVGCGSGKQCFSFFDELKGLASIMGGDVSDELLSKARTENTRRRTKIEFILLDFNNQFELSDNKFDLVSCCFAIYYAKDIPFTIKEMHRVLKPNGCLFTTGPMPENKSVFYKIIEEATGKQIPPMPGSSRYSSEILTTLRNQFSRVEVNIFENPLVFKIADPFLAYTRASLSEDRKLWSSFFSEADDFEKVMQKITEVVNQHIAKEGKIVMTKVVGGFTALK
ncbi:MAG TPA: class I SAM-dependent methyltransferase [Anaerolineae bacterium]|nr:class I SAM-dependent methyltransferase [Anaerolineae bacterium]